VKRLLGNTLRSVSNKVTTSPPGMAAQFGIVNSE
jgi:hypothetical protein